MLISPKQTVKISGDYFLDFTAVSSKLVTNELIEFSVISACDFNKYYDEDEVFLRMEYGLNNSKNVQYGFLMRNREWRIRISVSDVGLYSAKLILCVNKQKADEFQFDFEVLRGTDLRGTLNAEPNNKKHFAFENGENYTAFGENLCWGKPGENRLEYYKRMIEKFARYGLNWTRIWLTAEWFINLIPKNSYPCNFLEKQTDFELLDEIVSLLEKNGIYVQMVLFNHGNLRSEGNDSSWNDFGFNNETKEGYLEKPSDFFINEQAIRDVKSYIRYISARYGYSTHILCWELFNEANAAEGDFEAVCRWHRIMTEYFRKIDIRKHMITTSSASVIYPLIYDNMFDFINIHRYGEIANIYHLISDVYWASVSYNRPVLLSECGASWSSGDANEAVVHQYLWAGAMCNSAGGGMLWFWFEHDEIPNNAIYKQYYYAAEFFKNIRWNNKKMRHILSPDLKISNESVNAMGYLSEDFAVLWFYDNRYTFFSKEYEEIIDTKFTLSLDSGVYILHWYDAWTGKTVFSESITVDLNGTAITINKFSRDISLYAERKRTDEDR